VEPGTPGTNLIIHHGLTQVFDQTAKPIHILGAVKVAGDLSSLCQWGEVFEKAIQIPANTCTSDRPLTSEIVGLPFEDRPPLFLLVLALGGRRTYQSY